MQRRGHGREPGPQARDGEDAPASRAPAVARCAARQSRDVDDRRVPVPRRALRPHDPRRARAHRCARARRRLIEPGATDSNAVVPTTGEIAMFTTYALIVFAIAALGGLFLASHVLRGKFAPWAVSILHALLGATGLVLLLLQVMQGNAAGRVVGALGLLVVAALGGFYLAALHGRKTLPPKGVVVLHAGLAVAGFLVLLSAVLAA